MAFDAFMAADAEVPLQPSDLALLADAAYATGHLETTIEAWERVHAASLAAGDRVAAAGAAVKVALHLLIDTSLLASVRGWAKTAERLLEGHDEGPVHAWLEMVRTFERFLSGDFDRASRWSVRAIELGTRHGEPGAAAMGRIAQARILLFAGKIDEGLELLDESAVTAVSGELDPLTVGIIYCELLCASQGLALYDRAEEWTKAMERWRGAHGIGSLGGRCRVHRAELLRVSGASDEAEQEALTACEELRPYLRMEFGWPLTELGRIRLRKGDLAGAEEAFLDAHEIGWDPQPGLSLLRLAQGEVAAAVSSIRDALDHPLNVPSKELPPNNDLRRAPLLAAQVEIEIAAGDVTRARQASDDLNRIVSSFQSKGLAASAALASGRVLMAEGSFGEARRELDRAVRLWMESGAPYEAALARVVLAAAHRAQGNMEGERLELRAATATFERVGAATAATNNEASFDRQATAQEENVFRREGDFWLVAFDGRTVRLRNLTGMRYLARLFATPGNEHHVLDLVGGVDPSNVSGDAGAMLDTIAKDAYRRRLNEIEEDLAEAQEFNDSARAARAEAEREFLMRELSRAVGLTGRLRRAGDASERARASVTRAIRSAVARITEHHPALGAHLDTTIRTGTYCAYIPDSRIPVAWRL